MYHLCVYKVQRTIATKLTLITTAMFTEAIAMKPSTINLVSLQMGDNQLTEIIPKEI